MKVAFVALLLVLVTLASADYCQISYGGEDYDLTNANNEKSDYIAQDIPGKLGPNIYYIQPCATTVTNCSGTGNSPTPVCQKDTNGNFHSCGQLNTQVVAAPSNTTYGPYLFQLGYKNGQQGRSVTILFKCNSTVETGNVFQKVSEPIKSPPGYQVYFETNLVCAGTKNSNGGLIFIIIVFALLGVYFIGGALYMKFARHAEGREIIPNHEFWFDLPTLIKDGCMFLVNKVRGRSGYSTVE